MSLHGGFHSGYLGDMFFSIVFEAANSEDGSLSVELLNLEISSKTATSPFSFPIYQRNSRNDTLYEIYIALL